MIAAYPMVAAETLGPGLVLSPFGIALFGVFGLLGLLIPVILVLTVANVAGGHSRSHGDPSGIGVAIGFTVLFVVMLALGALVA